MRAPSTRFVREKQEGDSLMPTLCALEHPALCAVQSKLHGGEHLHLLDDVYTVSPPERTCDIHGFFDARNKSGIELVSAKIVDPHAKLCMGAGGGGEREEGRVVVSAWHQGFRDTTVTGPMLRSPLVCDLQSAWVLLLFCAQTCANRFLRVVHPSASKSFARHHDTRIWLQCPSWTTPPPCYSPFGHGGSGLRAAHGRAWPTVCHGQGTTRCCC